MTNISPIRTIPLLGDTEEERSIIGLWSEGFESLIGHLRPGSDRGKMRPLTGLKTSEAYWRAIRNWISTLQECMPRPIYSWSQQAENSGALARFPGQTQHATQPTCVRACVHAKSLQSCPTLCDPMDHHLSGSSAHGILQARTLEWVAMPSSRGSSQHREDGYCHLHWQVGSLPLVPTGKPHPAHIRLHTLLFCS